MTAKLSSAQNEVTRSSHPLDAAGGLALVRVTISVMFICFFLSITEKAYIHRLDTPA
jgi:hypothetical protein